MSADVVFGPDRPAAARRAFGALREARARLAGSHPYSGEAYDRLLKAVREAEQVRAQYGEYGDTMFGGTSVLSVEISDRWYPR